MTPIPGVKIENRDTVQLGMTDKEGNFKIELPTGTNQLTFSFIGMERTLSGAGRPRPVLKMDIRTSSVLVSFSVL